MKGYRDSSSLSSPTFGCLEKKRSLTWKCPIPKSNFTGAHGLLGLGARVALGFAGGRAGKATRGCIERLAVGETSADKCPGRGGGRTRGESELDRVESP
ncbi:MAG: hypothetical protein DVB23_001562 [Verrucomicrobia bacterium]|nr:MAG: hypothetical protein DVB23_001562 [Verrucomicrobiota bacterium]